MNKSLIILFLLAVVIFFPSCDKNDPPLPDNLVAFSTDKLGFEDNVNKAELKLSLSRPAESETSVMVDLAAAGIAYGAEFTTEPAAVDNKVSVKIPAGSSEALISVIKKDGVLFDGDEKIAFSISSVSGPVLPGEHAKLELSFSAITSVGSRLTLDGGSGGASAENSVFVDLSANRQTAVKRNLWDLGFYCGADYRVIINNTNGASAIRIDKSDLSQVSTADVNVELLRLGQGTGSFSIIDDVNGDLSKTVIAEVSATAADNKVYVINRKGGDRSVASPADLYKVRVFRKDNGYTLQYARLNESAVRSLDIARNPSFNFSYVSFDNGSVSVEPEKARWDIEWGWSMYYTQNIPYGFADLVFINHRGGVQAAEVLTSNVSYQDFNEGKLAAVAFSGARDVIGSKWRATSPAPAVKTDRFYVIKDGAGNVYKLRFLSFSESEGGVRGKPEIEYALVKKGG